MNIFVYSSIPRNIKNYIHRCYVPRCFHRLIEEFTVSSSVIQLYSSVVTNEFFVVSCSACLNEKMIEHVVRIHLMSSMMIAVCDRSLEGAFNLLISDKKS
jgi:hypothetical protein